MSRFMLNQSRLLMRPSPLMARRALFSTGPRCLEQQQQQQNTTHFGFRNVAEEEKESLGKRACVCARRGIAGQLTLLFTVQCTTSLPTWPVSTM